MADLDRIYVYFWYPSLRLQSRERDKEGPKVNKMILSLYSKLSNRADVIGAITGSFIATVFGANIVDLIYWSPVAVGVMMSGIGNNWPLYLKVMNLIFGAAIGFTAIRIINAWLIQNRIVDPAKTKDIKHYTLPEWIKPKTVFSVT